MSCTVVTDLVLSEGSVVAKAEGEYATATITIIDNTFNAGDKVTINGEDFEEGVDWNAGGSITLSAAALAAAINASQSVLIKGLIKATSALGVVTLQAIDVGEDGNAFTLTETDGATNNFTLSGALFTGGQFCQGEYKAEEAGADFIAPLEEGLEFSPARELLERNVRTSTTESVASRVGIKSATGALPLELKAGSTEGALPEWYPLLWAALGGKRRSVNTITTDVGHTSTVINLLTADINKIKVGDVIKLKKTGVLDQDWISPVTAVDTDAETITILLPAKDISGATVSVPNGTVIAPFTTFYVDHSKAPTLSVTNYVGGKIREKMTGARPNTVDFNNISTGQIADMTFSLDGINLEKEVGTPLFTPEFDTSVPPIMLDAKVYFDLEEILVNTMSLSLANTVGFKTATGDPNGRIASRITDFNLTGSIDPYQEDDNVDKFSTYNQNDAFSLFMRAFNPTTTSGEKTEVVAMYVPNCRITEFTTGDQEGLATDAISFSGHKTNGNDTVFITVI